MYISLKTIELADVSKKNVHFNIFMHCMYNEQ